MPTAAKSLESHLNDAVTAHMRTDLAKLSVDQTVSQALSEIRRKPPEGRVIYFYVVDAEGCLQGVVPTRRLLLSAEETSLREIMVQNVVSIPSTASVLDACEFFVFHKLLAFPVVDEKKRLIGLVDVELYTDELSDIDRREDYDDLFQLIGVHLSEAEQASSVLAFRGRFPWLLANIGGGILAAFLSGVFEAELQKAVALALFIPVVLALAESVSIQSVSLSLQALHGKRPNLKAILKGLKIESVTGMMLGVACALSVGLVSLIWLAQPKVTLCILGGITGGVTCAAVIGTAIPSILRLLKREPQVASGPIALAATDMVTLLIYFMLARFLFAG